MSWAPHLRILLLIDTLTVGRSLHRGSLLCVSIAKRLYTASGYPGIVPMLPSGSTFWTRLQVVFALKTNAG